ncbi:STAS domain-containing protein [bacterium]|nr:STAS domain-containing protein [bacterium]
MKPFSIDVTESPSATGTIDEVRVCGFLDAHTVNAFDARLQEELDRDVNRFLLDFEELTYISSAGIGSLMVLLQQVRRNGGELVILNPQPKVYSVLDLLGFTKIFHIANDREAALQELG